MCLIWGREPGCAPGGAVTFSCSPRESHQREGDPTVRVPSLRYGQPAMLGQGVRRRTHCALAALRSNNCGESVHEVRVSYGTRTHPLPCASRHAQKGTRNRTSTRAIASLGPVCAGASASRCAIQAERSDGPYGCWAVGLLGCWAVGLLGCWAATPLLYAPGARRRRGGVGVPQDTPALRQLTRRVCLNGAPQARSELRGAPRIRAPQVAGL
jgi:hypothetical protein